MTAAYHRGRRLRRRRFVSLIVVGVVSTAAALALAGCSSLEPDGANAASVGNAFVEAIAAGNGADACALLNDSARQSVAKQTDEDCADGIRHLDLDLDGTVTSAQIYSRAAFVEVGDSALFLTVGPHDWAIRAAGCVPNGDRPFDCVIDGS
ncbi:hypothetical protein C5E11_04780 [Clavibacter michiganensis]|nr:hypothetical protein [Clavibacter michiganensis]PPF64032.1 hypothetical protein C5E11_04780 [Clavibacter michiganensis]